MTRSLAMLLLCLAGPSAARAQPPACAEPAAVVLVLSAADVASEPELVAILPHLSAGFASSGVAVCATAKPGQRVVAEVGLARSAADASRVRLLVRVHDPLTHKRLERTVDLTDSPEDSRALLLALYIEELVQASWIELSLRERTYLAQHPADAPAEVKREISALLPPPVEVASTAPVPVRAVSARSTRALRLSLAGAVSGLANGLLLLGPELSFTGKLAWLELGLRLGYRAGLDVRAPHGTIGVQALSAGALLVPCWRLSERWSALFPQAIDVARVQFSADARPQADAHAAIRPAVLVSHGLGARLSLISALSLSVEARFAWTLLPAEAADDGLVITGLAGVGGEGALALDVHF